MLCRTSLNYQLKDKCLDVFFYAVTLLCLQHYCYFYVPKLLWGLLAWRTCGVLLFFKTKKVWGLIMCLDLIKEMILLHELVAMGWIHHSTSHILCALVVLKFVFEMRWHKAVKRWTI
jgi:hypothetical protein